MSENELIVYYALVEKWNGDPTMRPRSKKLFDAVKIGDFEYSWGRFRKVVRIDNAPFGKSWCKRLVLEK